ncbi:MAG: lysophospholipid acyltransferase family protein [Verrucomicrobia bacterium]|jgi:Kdo2-lipid IVA lauroyltransferase/acyltransferase|nr:lysophospholipid acyltransferase family protein [Verrucomicrobiota bacterium]
MKKRHRRIRRAFEYLLLLLGRCTIPLLPRRAILALSRGLGRCAYRFSHKLRKYAEANLDIAFEESKTPEEKRQINIASFQNFALLMLDLFWFNFRTKKRLRQYLKYDESFQILFRDPPAIVVTAHYGNWEVVSLGCGLEGHPMTSVAMPLKNPFADSELYRLRAKTGSEITSRDGAIRHVIRALRAGRGTALLVDQNVLPKEGGVFVPFFGLPVPVTKAVGSLWSRTQAKIMVSWCIPDEHGVYTVHSKTPFPEAGEDLSSDEIAARVTKGLEDIIREQPEYWLWSYRRWRYYQEGDDPSLYPFYARKTKPAKE